MQLADRFLSYKDEASIWADSPKLFYLWGHSYEFDRDNNWNIMEEFAKKVGNKEDVWYATNVEIYDYVNAYERLEYSIDGKTIYNPSVISVYMNYFGQAVRVCCGETVTVNLYKKRNSVSSLNVGILLIYKHSNKTNKKERKQLREKIDEITQIHCVCDKRKQR